MLSPEVSSRLLAGKQYPIRPEILVFMDDAIIIAKTSELLADLRQAMDKTL